MRRRLKGAAVAARPRLADRGLAGVGTLPGRAGRAALARRAARRIVVRGTAVVKMRFGYHRLFFWPRRWGSGHRDRGDHSGPSRGRTGQQDKTLIPACARASAAPGRSSTRYSSSHRRVRDRGHSSGLLEYLSTEQKLQLLRGTVTVVQAPGAGRSAGPREPKAWPRMEVAESITQGRSAWAWRSSRRNFCLSPQQQLARVRKELDDTERRLGQRGRTRYGPRGGAKPAGEGSTGRDARGRKSFERTSDSRGSRLRSGPGEKT